MSVTSSPSNTTIILYGESKLCLLPLAESQDMVGHLTGESTEPTKSSISTTDKTTDDITAWTKSDRLLCGWLIGTLAEEALSLAIGQNTAKSVWDALKEAHAQDSLEREFTLKQQLTYICKDENTTIGEHIRNFKGICDNLAAIESPVTDKVKVFSLLASLGPKYESFTTTMLKPPRLTYIELVSLLQGYEQRQNWFTTNATRLKQI